MRPIILLASVIVSACAAHPPSQADMTPHQEKVDASNIVEVQKAGYTIKNKNGEKLYCTSEGKTGSHIEKTTTCLTEAQWQRVHDTSQRSMQSISSQLPPPQGH
jgi:hypothetical protein